MKRFKSDEFKNNMKIRYDFNNLMDSAIDAKLQDVKFQDAVGAISKSDIEAMLPKYNDARKSLDKKLGKAEYMLAWTELAYNQDEIVSEILDYAKKVQDKFDNFVVLGIGGSALGPIALQQALNHMKYNDLSKKQRKAPRFFVEDNVDPERMLALLDIIDVKKTCFNVVSKSGSTSEGRPSRTPTTGSCRPQP